MPDITETLANIKAAKAKQREAAIATWRDCITNAIAACAEVRQADVATAADEQKLTMNLAWVSLNEQMPKGSILEAWVDNEGVLDIEVPRDIGPELGAWLEHEGLKVGTEYGGWPDRIVLHVCVYDAPNSADVTQ